MCTERLVDGGGGAVWAGLAELAAAPPAAEPLFCNECWSREERVMLVMDVGDVGKI